MTGMSTALVTVEIANCANVSQIEDFKFAWIDRILLKNGFLCERFLVENSSQFNFSSVK